MGIRVEQHLINWRVAISQFQVSRLGFNHSSVSESRVDAEMK